MEALNATGIGRGPSHRLQSSEQSSLVEEIPGQELPKPMKSQQHRYTCVSMYRKHSNASS